MGMKKVLLKNEKIVLDNEERELFLKKSLKLVKLP
jgi:hypothetical protein